MTAFPDEFNLDALLAEQKPDRPKWQFRFGGETYSLPPKPDVRFAIAAQSGEFAVALRILLGSEQWGRFCASDPDNPLSEEGMQALFESYAAYTGSTVGESSGSAGSSVSTVEPSKLTSNGSTQPTLVR